MNLRTKLFLISGLTVGGVALLALLLLQSLTQSSFRDYQQASRDEAARALGAELQQAYAQGGDWRGVLREAYRWPQMHLPLPRARGPRERGGPAPGSGPAPGGEQAHGGMGPGGPRGYGERADRDGAPRRAGGPRPRAPEAAGDGEPPGRRGPGAGRPLREPPPPAPGVRLYQLHDAQRRPLTNGEPAADPVWLALQARGEVVGWLSWPRLGDGAHPLDIAFARRAQQALWATALGALLLSALVGWALSGLLLGRIRRLQAATQRIAAGALDVAIDDPSRDELGALARDFGRMSAALAAARGREQQWLADIAHELRTPLAVLRGEIEALQDGVRRTDAAALESLAGEVAHLGALVEDLHLLSASEAGALPLQRETLDLGAFAAEVLERHAPPLRERGFVIEAELPEGPRVEADARRLQQVLDNLLQNLRRYATPGPVRIRVWAEGAEACLALADSGPGVPASALPRLFDRLYRVDGARTRSEGSGLGLAICAGIIQAHGGRITARASAAGGLEFEFRLPRAGMEAA